MAGSLIRSLPRFGPFAGAGLNEPGSHAATHVCHSHRLLFCRYTAPVFTVRITVAAADRLVGFWILRLGGVLIALTRLGTAGATRIGALNGVAA